MLFNVFFKILVPYKSSAKLALALRQREHYVIKNCIQVWREKNKISNFKMKGRKSKKKLEAKITIKPNLIFFFNKMIYNLIWSNSSL